MKFLNFLDRLETDANRDLLEAVRKGFLAISESLSTDDANRPVDPAKTFGVPANALNMAPNDTEEWFPQNLPDEIIEKVIKAQSKGKKVAQYPTSGQTPQLKDAAGNQFGAYQNANNVDFRDYGDSGTGVGGGGYNLGG